MADDHPAVTLQDVEDARDRIRDAVHLTPLEHFESLSDATGNHVGVKLENLQRTGSFKVRGALNKMLSLTETERAAGVICASAGNHAQGVAYGGQRLGIHATIVMPLSTPLVKVSACRAMGAEVVLHGRNYDEAYAHACKLRDQKGATFVHPFNDPQVIAGQGTVGLEILEQWPDTECIVVPVGGGGLIAGIATAVKARKPAVAIYGVEPAAIAAMDASLSADQLVELPGVRTLADGLATRRVGDVTFEIVREHTDGIATVEEEEIASAILQFIEQEKTVAEGAGAAALAALMNRRLPLKGKNVVLVLSGGNIDVNILSRIIERGLVKDGRMVRLIVRVPDEPGSLARLTALLAKQRANIVEIHHLRAFGTGTIGETDVQVTLETRGFEHIDALLKALRDAGYRAERED